MTLPGIGKKSAYRIAFYFLRLEESLFNQFISNLLSFKQNLRFCNVCFGITENEVCDICESNLRESFVLCIVEQPEDIFFIENTGEYKGKYHVLHGVISPLDGIGPEQLKIADLLKKIDSGGITEVILATNPTLEGEATATYLTNTLKDKPLKITRIAYGVPLGSTLEYADQYTLGRAIKARLPFQ
ncbi:MAG: recombination protein RecR [Leptospiraceae bacterium]|nr:recombination protein RecR [Leptospiraceae bacterium]MCP5495593.1 recombination protein RecR [Leptospiraceae bacterium]